LPVSIDVDYVVKNITTGDSSATIKIDQRLPDDQKNVFPAPGHVKNVAGNQKKQPSEPKWTREITYNYNK
jgi:hypothetical protein